jgi:hypothetical protein
MLVPPWTLRNRSFIYQDLTVMNRTQESTASGQAVSNPVRPVSDWIFHGIVGALLQFLMSGNFPEI